MDTSLEYVQMCRKAQEIQDAWNFELGDYFTTSMSAKHGHECCIVDTFWIDDQSRNPRPAPWVWLPTQSQLQDIVIIDDKFGKNFYSTIKHFTSFVRGENFVCGYVDDATHEQMWLRFTMYYNYSEVWDGAEWVSA